LLSASCTLVWRTPRPYQTSAATWSKDGFKLNYDAELLDRKSTNRQARATNEAAVTTT